MSQAQGGRARSHLQLLRESSTAKPSVEVASRIRQTLQGIMKYRTSRETPRGCRGSRSSASGGMALGPSVPTLGVWGFLKGCPWASSGQLPPSWDPWGSCQQLCSQSSVPVTARRAPGPHRSP